MKLKVFLCICMLFIVSVVSAEDKQPRKTGQAKALSGMSIVGSDDAPKSLYIVPWKSSELGIETTPDMPASKGYAPVDREEFKRKIDYYYVSTNNDTGR